MSVVARTWTTLLVIALVVAGLGLYRSSGKQSATEPGEGAPTGLPSLLDFGRGECLACKKMMPVLDTLADRHGAHVSVRYFDLGDPEASRRATELGVRLIPTQILIDAAGVEVERHEGFWPLDVIERRLEELAWIPSR